MLFVLHWVESYRIMNELKRKSKEHGDSNKREAKKYKSFFSKTNFLTKNPFQYTFLGNNL